MEERASIFLAVGGQIACRSKAVKHVSGGHHFGYIFYTKTICGSYLSNSRMSTAERFARCFTKWTGSENLFLSTSSVGNASHSEAGEARIIPLDMDMTNVGLRWNMVTSVDERLGEKTASQGIACTYLFRDPRSRRQRHAL